MPKKIIRIKSTSILKKTSRKIFSRECPPIIHAGTFKDFKEDSNITLNRILQYEILNVFINNTQKHNILKKLLNANNTVITTIAATLENTQCEKITHACDTDQQVFTIGNDSYVINDADLEYKLRQIIVNMPEKFKYTIKKDRNILRDLHDVLKEKPLIIKSLLTTLLPKEILDELIIKTLCEHS